MVLPLVNLSGDASRQYLADGITDALITDLAGISALRVVSRASAMSYQTLHKTAPEIGRELDVDAVLESSMTYEGERVRVNAKLVVGHQNAVCEKSQSVAHGISRPGDGFNYIRSD